MSQDIAKEIAKKELKKLVDNFKEHINSYKNSDYNESTLRIDYLNKFFTLLGWDVANNQNLPPSYREVITEDKVQIEGRAKAPDYSFRLVNGKRLFFVEAKKPAVNISKHTNSAFQLRRYGWSADLPVSILTNFEYFSVYDCTIKPLYSDAVKKARLKIISYEEYLDEFDYIWDRFSKEAVLKDSLVLHFGSKKKKKGTASVDNDFLNSLDGWRIALAKDINSNNNLDEDRLNFIVQQTIDRIIFLRIAEDRDVEDYGAIQKCLEDKNHYKNLYQIFIKADQKYNSGLFKQDELSAKVKISDSVISKFINGLYYPKSPYEFSVLPIEILGKAYEQFLGKKITLTNAGNIKIEDKPEVKKAGGVYYTPKHIVDYIVQNTVGKLCEGKTPEKVAELKILDPASGSGSFLIGAYEYLLQWYKDYFTKNPNEYSKKRMSEILTPDGELTTRFKGKVLLENIYGVDIDANAVEVTKLSLLLKCMEGETKETVNAQRSLFQERLLPTLENNIKCGNSLIDFDIYSVLDDYDEDIKIKRKINAFSWEIAFKTIMAYGGFDIIVGNPPYGALLSEDEKRYFHLKYPLSKKYLDTYCLFLLKSSQLENSKKGIISFIIPNTFCDIENGVEFREWILNEGALSSIYQSGFAFEDAIVDTVIVVLNKNTSNESIEVVTNNNASKIKKTDVLLDKSLKIDFRNSSSKLFLFKKITDNTIPLGSLVEVRAGVKLYEKGKGVPPQDEKILRDRPYTKIGIKPKKWQPLYRGKNIDKFEIFPTDEFVNYGEWLAAPRNSELFKGPKLIMRRTDDRLFCGLDLSDSVCVNSCHIIKLRDNSLKIDIYYYLLGLINSKLMQFIFEVQNPQMVGKVYSEIKVIYVERLSIKAYVDTSLQKEISELSKKITELKASANILPSEIKYYQAELDKHIYHLYGLTVDEIKLLEEELRVQREK